MKYGVGLAYANPRIFFFFVPDLVNISGAKLRYFPTAAAPCSWFPEHLPASVWLDAQRVTLNG